MEIPVSGFCPRQERFNRDRSKIHFHGRPYPHASIRFPQSHSSRHDRQPQLFPHSLRYPQYPQNPHPHPVRLSNHQNLWFSSPFAFFRGFEQV